MIILEKYSSSGSADELTVKDSLFYHFHSQHHTSQLTLYQAEIVQNRDSSKRDFANSLNAISDIGIAQSRGETKSKILC